MPENHLHYSINGKVIQKICDSYRISDEWKEKFKGLRPGLRNQDDQVRILDHSMTE
jgi:hypothetical protein